MAEASADMQTIAGRLQAAYPATNRGENIELKPLREQLVGTLRPAMLSLLGAVLLVLLIACVNVANLLLVRAAAQRREIAVRRALGADRWQIFLQFLAQTMVLCLAGGVLGVGLAAVALPLLRVALSHTAGLDAGMIDAVGLSWPVLGFALAVCVVTAVVFGLLPLVRGMGGDEGILDALKPGDRGSAGGRGLGKGALIAGEIAIAVVVVFLGALVSQSYARLVGVDPGFRTDHLLTAEITLPEPRYSDDGPATARFYEQLLARLQSAPGVTGAATTTQTPLRSSQVMTRFLVQGAPALAPGTYPVAQMRFVSAAFFQTMGLRVVDGRVFTAQDVDGTDSNPQPVMVVNEAFAKLYLGGRSAVGSTVLIGVMTPQPTKFPVIGVVSDAHDLGVDAQAEPELFMPGYGLHAVVLMRSWEDAAGMIATLRGAVHDIDPQQPVYHVQTVDAVLSDSLARQRMTAVLLGIFAAVALALAGIGIYGVLSYSVAQRRREIGVRMAVGANRVDVLRLVLGQAGVFSAAGIAVGLAAAYAGARLMRGLLSSLLFATSTLDGASVSVAVGALVVIAAMAVSVPAWRAASVQPSEALRAE
jgi:predicted permease